MHIQWLMASRASRLAVAAAVMVATFGAGTPAGAAPKNESVIGSTAMLSPKVAAMAKGASPQEQQEALASYWTPARMAAALPESEIPAVKAAAAAAQKAGIRVGRATPDGPAGQIPPAEAKAPPVTTFAPTSTVTTVQPSSYYPNYPVGHPVARTNGKVFFTSLGVDHECSATIVNTESKSVVWTAGHCVSDGGAWNFDWVFVPNYSNWLMPFNFWFAGQLWTTTAWFNNNEDVANDVGAAVLYRDSGGRRIANYLGAQGITWNQTTFDYAYAFGYPADPPFDGQYLVAASSYIYNAGSIVFMFNDMTGGSSGGGWLIGFNGNWGRIGGHNDFGIDGWTGYMFSPYYGNQVAALYNAVRYLSA